MSGAGQPQASPYFAHSRGCEPMTAGESIATSAARIGRRGGPPGRSARRGCSKSSSSQATAIASWFSVSASEMFHGRADAYDRFVGRYSARLAAELVEFAGVPAGGRAVDVGCGPGGLTAALAERL